MSQNSFDQRAEEVRGQRAYKEFFREQHMVRNISHTHTCEIPLNAMEGE